MSNKFFDIDPLEVAKLSNKRVETAKVESGCATLPLLDKIDRTALLKDKAEIWTRASINTSKAAEVVLEEITRKLDLPFRKNGLEINATWNMAMAIFGMCLAKLPKGWEDDIKENQPNEVLGAIATLIQETFLKP